MMRGKYHFFYILTIAALSLGGWWKDIQKEAAHEVIRQMITEVDVMGTRVIVKGFVMDEEHLHPLGTQMYILGEDDCLEEVYDSMDIDVNSLIVDMLKNMDEDKGRTLKVLEKSLFFELEKKSKANE